MILLKRHVLSLGGEGLTLEAEAVRSMHGRLGLRYRLRGDLAGVRLPAAGTAERADELWRTTCFEAFVAGGDGGYVEFNFAPSTRWAAYRFSGRRDGMENADVPVPRITSEKSAEPYELRAEVAGLPADGPWRVGLTAVIEDSQGRTSYWALAHPGEKPDFHHPDSFVLELGPP
jgi:hypothetical protein